MFVRINNTEVVFDHTSQNEIIAEIVNDVVFVPVSSVFGTYTTVVSHTKWLNSYSNDNIYMVHCTY